MTTQHSNQPKEARKMAGFKANKAVEVLTYNLKPYRDEQGTIEEPSAEAIEKYQDVMVEAMQALGLDPEVMAGKKAMDPSEMGEVMNKSKQVNKDILTATSELTGVDLDGLPGRLQQAFCGWISGEFMSSEGGESPEG